MSARNLSLIKDNYPLIASIRLEMSQKENCHLLDTKSIGGHAIFSPRQLVAVIAPVL